MNDIYVDFDEEFIEKLRKQLKNADYERCEW